MDLAFFFFFGGNLRQCACAICKMLIKVRQGAVLEPQLFTPATTKKARNVGMKGDLRPAFLAWGYFFPLNEMGLLDCRVGNFVFTILEKTVQSTLKII